MSRYLEIINGNNSILIDDNSIRLSLMRKVTLNANYLDFQYDETKDGIIHKHQSCMIFRVYKVPMNSGEKICFAKCSSPDYGIACFNDDGYHVVTIFYTGSCDPSKVTLYIFGEGTPIEQAYGLTIYNSSGVKIFNSHAILLTAVKGVFMGIGEKVGVSMNKYFPEMDSQIDASNTAISCSSYLGYLSGFTSHLDHVLPVFWDGTLKLKPCFIYTYQATGYWKAVPIGSGYNLIAIDTTRFDR